MTCGASNSAEATERNSMSSPVNLEDVALVKQITPAKVSASEQDEGLSRNAIKRAKKKRAKEVVRKAHAALNTAQDRNLLEVLRSAAESVPRLRVALQDDCARGETLSAEASAALAAAQVGMQVEVPYRSLPKVFGSSSCGVQLVGGILRRPPKYEHKYIAQEVSLLGKVWALAGSQGGDDLAVVDIGAGNGCLALLATLAFGCKAVLVDHTLPREELRIESYIPQEYTDRILRITCGIEEVSLDRDVFPLLERHGIKRAVVVAKHLCGLGTDLALSFVDRWKSCQASPAAVTGAVIATCCGHKIGQRRDLDLYCGLYDNDTYLCDLVGGNRANLRSLLSVFVRHVSWRTTAECQTSTISERQVSAAELFEDVLQQPRLARLRRLFPAVAEVLFVPIAQSLQNRCLLAGEESSLEVAQGLRHPPGFLEMLAAARDAVHAMLGGPLDLFPSLPSAKYEYDGAGKVTNAEDKVGDAI